MDMLKSFCHWRGLSDSIFGRPIAPSRQHYFKKPPQFSCEQLSYHLFWKVEWIKMDEQRHIHFVGITLTFENVRLRAHIDVKQFAISSLRQIPGNFYYPDVQGNQTKCYELQSIVEVGENFKDQMNANACELIPVVIPITSNIFRNVKLMKWLVLKFPYFEKRWLPTVTYRNYSAARRFC